MKLFSPEKANALIPKVTPLVEELWAKRRELAIKLPLRFDRFHLSWLASTRGA